MATIKKINGDMLTLAREYRGLTQEQLVDKLKAYKLNKVRIGQSTIAKIETGIKNEIEEDIINLISSELNFPVDFFYQQEDVLNFGSSAYFYRKKATMLASERKKIHSTVNIFRIGLKKTLKFIDIEASRDLPSLEIDEYGNSASQVAKALRVFWSLPDGPIRNITSLIESSGVIVVPCDFGTRSIDATSLRLSEMPPLIFINKDIPGDRWRFTLAHELAHLIMHRIPHEKMEEEADEFAAEFLVPEEEITPQFRMMPTLKLNDLIKLKEYWKVSIAMLVMRAKNTDIINDTQVRYQFMMLSKNGFRINEPAPLKKETTININQIITTMIEELSFTKENIAKSLSWSIDEVENFFSLPSQVKNQAQLRVVK